MKITALRILPPIAIGRLGESEKPMAAYTLELSKEKPLDFRKIVPKETFTVDPKTGELNVHTPTDIIFKDAKSLLAKNGKVHPVAPFLEVFAITDTKPDELVPLTLALLSEAGLSLSDISWEVEVGNIKIFRRTFDDNDKIIFSLKNITTHQPIPLLATCKNFIEGSTLPLGTIQFIKPSAKFPEIRLRYTPAGGKVYGTRRQRISATTDLINSDIINEQLVTDPVFKDRGEEAIIYDMHKGSWFNYKESGDSKAFYTSPAQLFAGYANANEDQISWGYIDDECDGIVRVNLKISKDNTISAKAHISAGPPAFAPDTLPIRVVADELEQILLSTDIDGTVSLEEAEDIVRRAFETIRLMNTTVMNGNTINGVTNIASTMVRQNTNDFGRLYEPIMAPSLVDNLALEILHERVFNGLSTGASPWFADLLRMPDEIGDLSSTGLRKMPALMRGADGRSLTFTYRQINKIIKAATQVMFKDTNPNSLPESYGSPFIPSNRTAQLHYRATGNPYCTISRSAISNCFPGLEFDFRNLWRRAFKGLILLECNNYVFGVPPEDDHLKYLIHHRLVAFQLNPTANQKEQPKPRPTMVETKGPAFPGGISHTLLVPSNPNGISFMEWSNSMVDLLQQQGQMVKCFFTPEVSDEEVLYDEKKQYLEVMLEVNKIFDGDSAAFSDDILKPGELTQSLCAPWQNDYRECSCYYWAASRPDYVNVVADENGLSKGDNWTSKKRTGNYILDNWKDTRLVSYDDLFENWQGELNFIVKGKDALKSETVKSKSGKKK